MKKYILMIAAVFTAIGFSACDQDRLDEPQKGTYSESSYYKTDEDCESALAAVYASLAHQKASKGGFFIIDVCISSLLSDEAYKTSSGYKTDDYHSFMLSTYDATHSFVNNEFELLFKIVYRANLVIDNFKDGTSAIQKQAVAEAKVMRAWAYIKLISFWGTPPLVDHVPKTSADMQLPNSTQEELWNFVISSLDEAINSGTLESKDGPQDKSKVRVTKEFAQALKGKAQVFSGDYSGAKVTLKEVMNSGKYALVPQSQMELLGMGEKANHNSESLFETNVHANESNYTAVCAGDRWMGYVPCRMDKHALISGSYFTQFKGATWGYYAPSEKFVKAMLANEGFSPRFKAWFWTYEQNQEMGLDAFEHQKSESDQQQLDAMGFEKRTDFMSNAGKWWCAECAGIWNRKLFIPAEDMINGQYSYDKADRKYMRLAEVYLLFAEACAQLGETSGEGLDALNAIASRAGAPTYSSLTMTNVKKEKWFEMWMEGCRYVDLVRWGDASTELANHWSTVPVFYGYKKGKTAEDIEADGKNLYDVYDIRQLDLEGLTKTKYGFRPGQDEHLPFPASELANNPNLVQNPGW